jgi:YD repeat-containing protein
MKTLTNAVLRCLIIITLIFSTVFISCKGGAKRLENKDDVNGQNVKLLESIIDNEGKTFRFEYDEQNRIVKINDETITYADNLITVGSAKYAINGNTITLDDYSFTINGDGRVVGGGASYEYKDGNLINVEWEESGYGTGYEYDDKKSPFSNCNTPKWLIQNLLGGNYENRNNVVRLIGEGFVYAYKYDYDDEGFPKSSVRYTEESLDGDGGRNLTTRFNYRGEAQNVPDGEAETGDGDGDYEYDDASEDLITVSNAEELVAAIRHNRTIELQPGKYNLTRALTEEIDNGEVKRGVEREFEIEGINNLTIRGVESAKGKLPELIVENEFFYVIKFINCNNVVIENVSAGHSVSGYCAGGVFYFANVTGIAINNAAMYGSGTEGLTLANVSDMKVTNSRIYECTYHIMSVENSENIAFENCTFDNNKEYELISVANTKNMSFADCKFKDNEGRRLFSVRADAKVSVSRSAFSGNRTYHAPVIGSENVSFSDCDFDKAAMKVTPEK